MKTLFAHRGMSRLAPENTQAAFALCAQYGLCWVECDVDILGDDTVVLSHDNTLDRCTNRTGFLADLTREDLQDIDAGSWFSDHFIGEPLFTFENFIALANTHKLNINVEIKLCATWDQTLRLIEGVIAGLQFCHKDCDVLVSSFSPLALAEFKRKSPDTCVACLFEHGSLQADWWAILQACQAIHIHVEDNVLQGKVLTKEKVLEMKAHGCIVNVYTVNRLSRANQLFNWGVDGVFTDVGHLFPARYRYT